MPDVKGYRISYVSSSDALFQADLRCYGSTDLRADEVARIRFYAEPAAIPADSWVGGQVNGVPIVNYPLDRFLGRGHATGQVEGERLRGGRQRPEYRACRILVMM